MNGFFFYLTHLIGGLLVDNYNWLLLLSLDNSKMWLPHLMTVQIGDLVSILTAKLYGFKFIILGREDEEAGS